MSIVLSILAGYSLSRLRFRGASSFGTAVFITYLVPPTLLFLPLSQVVSWLGLSDSIYALMVTYPTFLVPFCTWLLMGYFRTVPREVEECALVDGATRMQTLLRIVLPMAVPGIICALLFSFTLCWNEFTYALTFVSQSANKTAVVGVTADLIRGDIYYWGSLMAGAVLASVPVVIVYVLFLDYYVSGLTAGRGEGLALRLPRPALHQGEQVTRPEVVEEGAHSRGGAPVEVQRRHPALPHLDPRATVAGDEGGLRLGQEGLVADAEHGGVRGSRREDGEEIGQGRPSPSAAVSSRRGAPPYTAAVISAVCRARTSGLVSSRSKRTPMRRERVGHHRVLAPALVGQRALPIVGPAARDPPPPPGHGA